MGFLFDTGAEIDIDTEISHQNQSSYNYQRTTKETTVISPTISPQYSSIYAPVIQLGSPSGQIRGAEIDQAPEVTGTNVFDTLTPTQTTEQSAESSQMTDAGSKKSSIDMIIGAVVVIAIIIVAIPLLLRRKKKK